MLWSAPDECEWEDGRWACNLGGEMGRWSNETRLEVDGPLARPPTRITFAFDSLWAMLRLETSPGVSVELERLRWGGGRERVPMMMDSSDGANGVFTFPLSVGNSTVLLLVKSEEKTEPYPSTPPHP